MINPDDTAMRLLKTGSRHLSVGTPSTTQLPQSCVWAYTGSACKERANNSKELFERSFFITVS